MDQPSAQATQETEGGLHTPIGTRRSFFGWIVSAAVAFIGIGLGLPLGAYVVSPVLKRRERVWIDVGDFQNIPMGEPEELEALVPIKDGWKETKTVKVVWTVRGQGDEVTVYSPICPHLGCGYRWNRQKRQFRCPCHGSAFDLSGKVLTGPAPRPLDVLPSKVENGRLLVKYKEFKSGLGRSVEM